MADMGEMEMPLPDNTLPMMTGDGPFGPVEMGGMFTRRQGARRPEAAATTRDPGWYKHPAGTVAYEWTGDPPSEAKRAPDASKSKPGKAAEFRVVDPRKRPRAANGGHGNH